jgi:hypothetical protein
MADSFKEHKLESIYFINMFRLRIFVDYSQVTVGGDTEINTVKRIMNISASYFYNVFNVTRLPKLYFPKNTSLKCLFFLI